MKSSIFGKLAKSFQIPIKNPQKDKSYRPIALLSPIVKTPETIILPAHYKELAKPHTPTRIQNKYSTITALQTVNNTIITGFSMKKSPERTLAIALDVSKAFDTAPLHQLLLKITQTSIPKAIVKYLSNYIRGRK